MTYWARAGDDEYEVALAISNYILSLMPEGPTEVIRKKHRGLPNAFQDLFLAFVLVKAGAIGQHLTIPNLPARLAFEAIAMEPIHGPAYDNLQAHGHKRVAEDMCSRAISSFRTVMVADRNFKGQLTFGNSEAGASTRTGDPYTDRRGNYFWIERLPFQVLLQLG